MLLASDPNRWPTHGARSRCPACESSDGVGLLPGSDLEWFCHSTKHAGSPKGYLVDFLLAEELGRMPTAAEGIERAREVLGSQNPGAAELKEGA